MIDISSINSIPSNIVDRLRGLDAAFTDAEYIEQLKELPDIVDIAEELHSICASKGVIGYHYCRGFSDRIESEGLTVATGQERRAAFLAEYGETFTDTQRARLVATWDDYFDKFQNEARDNKLWFNLTRNQLLEGGAGPLLYYYGGEVIYMPFSRDPEIGEILHSLGSPIVVSCHLDINSTNAFSKDTFSWVWVSSYHCSVNSNAYQHDSDVWIHHSLHRQNILAVDLIKEGAYRHNEM